MNAKPPITGKPLDIEVLNAAQVQALASDVTVGTYSLLTNLFVQKVGPVGNADPVIQGAIAGTLMFMLSGHSATDPQVLARITEIVEALLPQIRMAMASTSPGGRA